MHRLKNRAVFDQCVREGIESGAFGHASGYSEGDYSDDLRLGDPPPDVSRVSDVSRGLLVNPEMAQIVLDDRRQKAIPDVPDAPYTPGEPHIPGTPDIPDAPGPPAPLRPPARRRIVVGKTLTGDIDLNEVSLLQEEIIRNMTSDGAEVTISITVSARKPAGFSESVYRAIRENSQQMNLDFEDGA